MFSVTEENYLKIIFSLSGRERDLVNTNKIAERSKLTPASVTDMVKKLAAKGLIEYVPYKGVKLSKKGNDIATKLIRKHRLWEVFLIEKLNFTWAEVHEVAEQLEHINSEKLVKELDNFLDHPKFDPHGDPIPDEYGNIEYHSQKLLSELETGNQGVVMGVKDNSKTFLTYLDSLKISLGSTLEVLERISFDDSLILKKDGRTKLTVSKQVAQNIYISDDKS